jgi:hypothetical protein
MFPARSIVQGGELGSIWDTLITRDKLNNMLSQVERSHTLSLALDYDRKPWAFNPGIARGLNDATYRFKLKTIIEIPFN